MDKLGAMAAHLKRIGLQAQSSLSAAPPPSTPFGGGGGMCRASTAPADVIADCLFAASPAYVPGDDGGTRAHDALAGEHRLQGRGREVVEVFGPLA